MIKILRYEDAGDAGILARNAEGTFGVEDAVTEIIAGVRRGGDRAVLEYTERFDHVTLEALEVTREEIDAAYASIEPEFIAVMEEAAENIRRFHAQQLRPGFILNDRPGTLIGQKVIPLERVGLYIPGGTAAYPSTVLMDAIPAKLAGVGELIITSPPTGGAVNPVILAAAKIAGVDRVFAAGGAQAVAALAYGTESIPKVDKIFGPGNAYVAEAKRQVSRRVAIDIVAGPSEILVIADGASSAAQVAADLLSQAEHDKNASAVLVTDSEELALAVRAEIETQLAVLPRREIAAASIEANGKIILVKSLTEAVDISNRLAPEHLELCLDAPFDLLDRVKNAGSVFLGRNCPEALGDYFAGPNHTLPTIGCARFASPLSVDDFVKKMQYTYYTRDALGAVAEKIEAFAEREGLSGHARSVASRFGGTK